ncbi:hypothetical protein ACM0IS_01850 [Mycoplasma aquilae ATCC BAA-1896]|uniref:hypothetical protein n=1 Tax=Mycoplasma aquilae TaxID=1312741 RepID=UPI003A8C5221
MEANNAEGKITFTVELANKAKPEDKVTKDIVIADFAKVDQSAIDQLEQAQPKFVTITDADKIDALFKYLENNKIIKYYFKGGILNYKSGKGKNDFAEITSKTDRVFDAESGLGLSGAEEFIFSKTINKGKENEKVSVLPSSEIKVEVDAANKTITLHFRVNKQITAGVFAFSKVKTVQIKFEAAKPIPEPVPEPEPTPVVPEPEPVTPAGKSAEEVANTILAPVSASYSQIINSKTNALSEEQKQLITSYATSVAQGLAKESLGVLKAVEGVLPASENEMVASIYNQVALVLNKVLVDALQNAINQKSETGINTIKDFINADKMNAIIEDIANALTAKADDFGQVAKAVFDTLKTNDSTKNVANLEALSAEMSDFFKNQITAIAQKAKAMKIKSGESPVAALATIQEFLPEMKEAAAKKAHDLLPDQKDYDAVKAALKAKYEALEASVQSNLELLVKETMNLATLVDNLKLKKDEIKKAAELDQAEIEALMGKAVPTLVEAASKKTAFSATEADFVAPKFAENKDYIIEAIDPVFYADALSNKSALSPEAKEALKAKMLNGINEITYTIKVTSKKDASDTKTIEKTYDVAGFISKASADAIFKALDIKPVANINKDQVKIQPDNTKGMTKAYKFLHGTYEQNSLKKLALVEVTSPEGSVEIKVDNNIISSDPKTQSAVLEPVIYLDRYSRDYIFAFKDKSDVSSETSKVTVNELPTPVLSAKAISNFYGRGANKPYAVDVEKTVAKLGKALDQVLPSEISPEQIVLDTKEVTLVGSNEADKFAITSDMLAKMNGRVTNIEAVDAEGKLLVTVTFDTITKPNALYMLASPNTQTTDEEAAKAQVGTFVIVLEGLKQNAPEPEQPKPETEVVQGTAFTLNKVSGIFANVSEITNAKASSIKKVGKLFQLYGKNENEYYLGITSGGQFKDKNKIILFADGIKKGDIKFTVKNGKEYLDGEFDAEKKTLIVKYQQEINKKFVDVTQTFTLE